ncbi:hypothetical protein ACWA2B_10110 [Paenibacillus sp. CMM36]
MRKGVKIIVDIKELQGKYLDSNLTIEEAEQFLEYLHKTHNAPFREDRIIALTNLISRYKKTETSRQLWEEEHLAAAIAYSILTEKWLSHGAHWRELGSSMVKWYIGKECFFTWFSGVDSIEHLNNAKLADNEFERLSSES